MVIHSSSNFSSNPQSNEKKSFNRKLWIRIIIFLIVALGIPFQYFIWLLERGQQRLLAERQQQLKLEPISLEEVDELFKHPTGIDQHRRVHVRGKLLYDKTIRVGYDKNVRWGYRPKPGDEENDVGHLLFTPMICEDGRMVVINRGRETKYQQQNESIHSDGVVEIVGVVEIGKYRHLYLGEEERATDEKYGIVDEQAMYKKFGIVLEPNQRPILIDALDIAYIT